jgi:hypothetical protein
LAPSRTAVLSSPAGLARRAFSSVRLPSTVLSESEEELRDSVAKFAQKVFFFFFFFFFFFIKKDKMFFFF